MAIKDLFSNNKKYISRKDMGADVRHDRTFQKIVSDPKMGKLLPKPGNQKKLHDLFLEKARDGKFDFGDMESVANNLRDGRVSGISRSRGRMIAKEFLPKLKSDKPLIRPKKTSPLENSTSNKAGIKSDSKKKSLPTGSHSPSDNSNFKFVKSGFINRSSQTAAASPTEPNPVSATAQMAALMDITRKKIMEKNKKDGSENPKGSFSSAMTATMRNKRN
jgi:hypothetical protein